ncbi:flagellar basal body-associated protein FliL [Aliidiomarina sedimenti]|uniref:Flagellar protein FliL n=1 Tax=Aliidiomarina sedimenti TaxID=1933879 RepID=A0ABY0C0N1_9GAMM|nr:flagellar basal body-associated FliL family protein [Aliidiomarina sedimenti]RUO30699.1 flagellar basal body-associated protein FliL [Aliidiomarina sedimenti]
MQFAVLMNTKFWLSSMAALMLLVSPASFGNEEPRRVMYFPFDPDITTNFIKLDETRHLGYIRVAIEAAVSNPVDLGIVEHHAPLLRSAFVEIFGAAQEGKVRSMTGREELRQECITTAQELLERETGRPVIENLLFTTYMYQ